MARNFINRALLSTTSRGSVASSFKERYPDGVSPGTLISWYPGHIAKAERELTDYLKKVDVVIEVRDARIPFATTHPLVPSWVGSKPLIVAITRLDQVTPRAMQDWKNFYSEHSPYASRADTKLFFIDGKTGSGVPALKKEALKSGVAINEKRTRHGIQPRAVRAAVIGFPNVGKSALINRLLNRKLAKSMNKPGVTRSLQWVRIGGAINDGSSQENTIELLDSPGIIPARQVKQANAVKLAICNDIGDASYDRVTVAAAMCDLLIDIHSARPEFVEMGIIEKRYGIPFSTMSGEEIVESIADKMYQGNSISAADKLLGDYRKGYLGSSSLEFPVSNYSNDSTSSQRPRRVGLAHIPEDGEDNKFSEGSHAPPSADHSSAFTISDTEWVENIPDRRTPRVQKSMPGLNNLDVGRGQYDGW